MAPRDPDLIAFFTDISIIEQLVRTLMERRLPPGLSMAGFSLINHMVRTGQETASPAALARALQVTRGAITGVLHKLTAEGFVTLEPDPRDGRGKKVRLTREGLAVREAALAGMAPLVAEFEARMDLDAIRRAHPVLRSIREDLDHRRES
jgi:DNA-binding MarR family transcriptional regulator